MTFEEFWEDYNQDAHTGLPIFSESDRILAEDIWELAQEAAREDIENAEKEIIEVYNENMRGYIAKTKGRKRRV